MRLRQLEQWKEPVPAGINGTNTAIKATAHYLNTVLNTLLCNLPAQASDLDERDLMERAYRFQKDFIQMLIDIDAPEKHFDYIGHGAYKECYETGIPGWVVKFAVVSNPTAAERQLLAAATDYGVEDMLCDSFYIDLPVYLTSRYIDCNECGDCTWCNDPSSGREETYEEAMNVAILQPYVDIQDERAYTYLSYVPAAYDQQPVRYANGTPVALEDICSLDLSSLDWVQAIIDTHGDKIFNRFLQFARDFTLNDLHDKNIGYITGSNQPILLDWMSFDRRNLSD